MRMIVFVFEFVVDAVYSPPKGAFTSTIRACAHPDVAEEGDPRHSSLALVSDRASESESSPALEGV